ncbi:ClpP/crotonase [Gonapodya prolifera JEL478]|uniref:Ethylmalonyl-CoA decarboxylase n=1 Tax=Gonapodya prolifera (strain JEL478) TaxID=1344416 RepID=A0A139AJ74_GONPJ|nr:ClpP/crotonase [Gonapodya prolifera JEL478]|eukprot:KXS16614.1 ClpP/crotonase [Gonapodya prolifera JEL478]
MVAHRSAKYFIPMLHTRLTYSRPVFAISRQYTTTKTTIFREIPEDAPLRDVRENLRQLGGGSVELTMNHRTSIAYILLNNPSKKNSFSGKMMAELADIVDALEKHVCDSEGVDGTTPEGVKAVVKTKEQEDIRGVILHGASETFCAGFDLSVARSHMLSKAGGQQMSRLMHNTFTRFHNLPLVSVAAVEGYAIGGGAEATTACDFRVLHRDALVRFVHANMGIVPGWGGANRLTRLVGRRNALRLLGTTEILSAEQALEIGFADEIASEDESALASSEIFLSRFIFEDPESALPYLKQHSSGGLNSTTEDASSPPPPMHAPESLRGLKQCVIATDLEGAKGLAEERRVFVSLWGGPANLAAVSRPPSKSKHRKK